jgi:uncharacterized membrane protein YraQ (UPF0718 family)
MDFLISILIALLEMSIIFLAVIFWLVLIIFIGYLVYKIVGRIKQNAKAK